LIAPNPPQASIKVNKVDNLGNALDGAVIGLYSINNDTGSEIDRKTSSGGKVIFGNLNINTTYFVHEISAPAGYSADNGWYEVTTSADGSEVALGHNIVNNPVSQYGSIKINKATTDGLYGTFNFTIVQQNVADPYSTTVSITVPEGGPYNQSTTVGNLPAGDYLVTETGGDASASFSLPAGKSASVTVGSTSQVSFTNTPNTAKGQVTITKNIGQALDADITFYFDITPDAAGISEPMGVTIPAGSTSASYGPFEVPLGTQFSISEINIPTGWSLASSSGTSFTLTEDDDSAEAVFNNEEVIGYLAIDKSFLEGQVGSGTFGFEVYQAETGGTAIASTTITITQGTNGSKTISSEELVPGTTYYLQEVSGPGTNTIPGSGRVAVVAADSAETANTAYFVNDIGGSILINKAFTGGVASSGTFQFGIFDAESGGNQVATASLTINGATSGTVSVSGLILGQTYYVEEIAGPGTNVVPGAGNRIAVVAAVDPGQAATADFENDPGTGSITVHKLFGAGLGALVASPAVGTPTFTFSINTTPVQTATITGEGNATFTGLLAGNTYTITEATTGYSTYVSYTAGGWTPGITIAAEVEDGQDTDVYFLNDTVIEIPGSITVHKIIGEGVDADTVFNFSINTVPAQTVTIQGAGTATFANIEPGTYTITETTTGFATSVSYDGAAWTETGSIGAIVSGGSDTDVYFLNEEEDEEVEVLGISEPPVIEVLGITEELPYTGYSKWYYIAELVLVLGGVLLIQWFRRKEKVEYFI